MNTEHFIKEFSKELYDGNGAYFVGSGISKPSNLPDWVKLIQPFADELAIRNLEEKNLPLIAQYIVNESTGNKGPFIGKISKELRRKYTPNKYHEYISKTKLSCIWTTNYDRLLEEAFGDLVIDIKFSDDSISRIVPDAHIEIIKMHGCIFNSPVSEIVITEADYDDFFINRPATVQRLRMDFLRKSFLFIGYSYKDPNIRNIIVEARRLAKDVTRQHYLITLNLNTPEYRYWCNNLKRFGINVISINAHDELQEILETLSLTSRGRSVFVTGSHSDSDNSQAKTLGEYLASDPEIVLLDGQSTGPMRTVISAFMEKCITDKKDISRRLKFFANPYSANEDFKDDIGLLPLLKQWRADLLRSAHIVVAFDGGMGTKAEVEKAMELGCFIIPFPTKENGSATEFLKRTEIYKPIKQIWPKYLEKCKIHDLEIEDVYTLICKVFDPAVSYKI